MARASAPAFPPGAIDDGRGALRARCHRPTACRPPAPRNSELTSQRWVPPGARFNRVGYYEVANSRLVYRQGRGVHSFGIASMISWRGVWYVVHLGAVVRSTGGGVLDDPSSGAGTPTPSSTC